MLLPRNDIMSLGHSGQTKNRALAIGTVGMLHVVAIYALITGLASEFVRKYVPPDLQLAWIEPTPPPKTVPIPPKPKLTAPQKITFPTVPIPVFRTDDAGGSRINVLPLQTQVQPSIDSAAIGLNNTHSTPPYPAEARALSHRGMVLLQITVSPQGEVVSATVIRSSGYAELDQVARTWVIAHWKYRPAVLDGVAVTSQTQAGVKFDLKEARR